MAVEALLVRSVVVRRHQQDPVDPGGLRLLGQADGRGGVVLAGAAQDLRTVAHGLHDGAEQVQRLACVQGGGFAGGPGDHEPAAAVVDEVGCQPLGCGQVKTAIGVERRRHGGQQCGKSGGHRCSCGGSVPMGLLWP